MDIISGLPDELLVKILSFAPTKIAVSTSILSKRWSSLWKWVPKLDGRCSQPAIRDFILKNLPLRASIIESLCLSLGRGSFQPEDIKLWIGTAVSHCLRELCISSFYQPDVIFPRSFYTSTSLVTLELRNRHILVDVPLKGCLPSLKTLQLLGVTYSNEDSLRLLLSHCLVLEDLVIERDRDDDNVRAIVVIVPSLQRLTLQIAECCTNDGYEIVTPSLKYFKIDVYQISSSYMILSMPKLEEADINVEDSIEKILASVSSVKRLTLTPMWTDRKESVYGAGIVFDNLEQLKLCVSSDDWSTLLVWLLKNSPKLQVLNLYADYFDCIDEYNSADWKKNRSSAPECLKRSLKTLEFVGYSGTLEERDFLSFIFQNARCLKSSSISQTLFQQLCSTTDT